MERSESRPTSSGIFWIFAALLYAALAVGATWPVAGELGETMPGGGGDTYTGAWSLWYFHRALWRSDTDLSATTLLFHPAGAPLHFHVQNIGGALLAEPLQLLGLSLPAVFSLSWLLTFPLTGLGAAYLGLVATGSKPGALVAGALFMLCPFRTAHGLGQIELLGTQWMPLGAGLLLLAFPPPGAPPPSALRRCVHAGLAGAAMAMTILCSFYLGAFLGMLVLAYLLARALASREGRRVLPLAALAGGLTLSLPVTWPFLRAVMAGEGHYHLPTESLYPADLLGFVLPPYLNPLLGPVNALLTGDAKVWSGRPVEGTVGLGWTAIALGALGWRASERLWKLLAALFALLALGESLHVLGRDLGLPMPFLLLERIPVLRGTRVPSRFVIMVSLCLVPLCAAGVRRLAARAGERRAPLLVGALLLIGTTELAAIPYPTHTAALPAPLAALADDPVPGTLLWLPDIQSQLSTYLQTRIERPLVGGFVSRRDPALFENQWRLVTNAIGARRSDAERRQGLRALGVRLVVIEHAGMARVKGAPPWSTLEARLESAIGAPLSRGDGFTIYRIPPAEAEILVP